MFLLFFFSFLYNTGPFPAVNVKAMPLLARITEASFPCEVGTYTFNEDGSKITSGSYKGSTRSGGNPTPWFTERWNKKGDLSVCTHSQTPVFLFFLLFLLGYSKIACRPQYGLLEGTQRISSSC